MTDSGEQAQVTHSGGCHCGAVRFEVDGPGDLLAHECNCSMCKRFGFLHVIVPASGFRLLSGEDALTCYTFNTRTAQHLFCSVCGVKSFYVPRSNPDGFSVNARCIDPESVASLTVEPFDGANWEQHAERLRYLSED